jgi:hypothetical protein
LIDRRELTGMDPTIVLVMISQPKKVAEVVMTAVRACAVQPA